MAIHPDIRRQGLAVLALLCAFPDSASPQEGTPTRAATRRLWASGSGNFMGGGGSADGRLVPFLDGDGNLGVRDLDRDSSRVVLRAGTDGGAGNSHISPDGARITYEWYRADGLMELRVARLDAPVPRILHRTTSRWESVEPADWSPDGRVVVAIAIGVGGDRSGRILLFPAEGGDARLVKRFPAGRVPSIVRVSPDGGFLAYGYQQNGNGGKHEIHLVSIDGRRETVAVRDEGDVRLIGWTPDGTRLIYGTERRGSPSIWSVRIQSGRATGAPALIRRDLWRAHGLRVTNRGGLLYSVGNGDRDVLIASWDPTTGRLLSPPASLTTRPGEAYLVPAWSPDGRYVAYVTLWGGNGSVSGIHAVTIQSVEGRTVRTLEPGIGSVTAVAWTPDARALVLGTMNEIAGRNLFRYDLGTGVVTPLARGVHAVPAFSADGAWMYYVPLPDGPSDGGVGQGTRLVARNLRSGAEVVLYTAPEGETIPGMKRIVASPDGKWILFVTLHCCPRAPRLRLLDTRSGGSHELLLQPAESSTARIRVARNAVGFSEDGRHVLFVADPAGEDANRPAVWRVPLSGGDPERILDGVWGVPRLSPNGRRLIWVAGTQSSELWLLEDPALLAPAARPGRGRR